MKIFKIAFSNIRKRKSSAITVGVITMLAALMLSISLTLLMGVGGFYDAKASETNASHQFFIMGANMWRQEMYDKAAGYENTTAAEVNDLYLGNIQYKTGKEETKTQVFFGQHSVKHEMNVYEIIDKLAVEPENGLILPLSFKFEKVKPGDEFSFKSGAKNYGYTVYGFYENVLFGTIMSTVDFIYLTDGAFTKISADNNFVPNKFLSMQFKDRSEALRFESEFLNDFPDVLLSGSLASSKAGATMFPNIMSAVLILVSVIVVIIALIIARFAIINSIEEDVKALGALKSIGFTSKQIIGATALQFFILAALGAVLGSLFALALSGVITNIVSMTSGLLFGGSSMFLPIVLSILLVAGIVTLVTFLMARRSRKVTPINALRSGLSNHTFIKNRAPLSKTKLPLSLAMAAKRFVGNIKNNIAVFIMTTMFAFMTVLGFSLYHNFVVDTSAFRQMSGLEMNTVLVSGSEEFAINHFDEIKSRDDVRKTAAFCMASASVDNLRIRVLGWEDITETEADPVIEGRLPETDNEIAIPVTILKTLGKSVGDIVNVGIEGKNAAYLITGSVQALGTLNCSMTLEALARIKDNPVAFEMHVYLKDFSKASVDTFMNSMIENYGREIAYMENASEIMDNILNTIETPVAIATWFIEVISVFVICFTFFLMINTIIRRSKKDAGIMKAIGFTSGQLMIQTLLSFLPSIILGVALGSVLGIFLTNPLLGLMFGGLGIAKASFTIPPLLTVAFEAVLIVVCIVTIVLVSLKFRRIAPQKLITE